MERHTQRTWAEIDLAAIAGNISNIKKYVGEKSKVMAVVKADAYGHGAVQTAKAMLENGADCLGVAFIDEAEQLRAAGITAPVLILGYTADYDAARVVEAEVTPTLFSLGSAKAFSECAVGANKKVKIHIKLDTGMNRIGFSCTKESVEEIVKISKLENIEIEGIFTHFSCADEKGREYTDVQAKKFIDFVSELEKRGVKIPVKHACNSAGVVRFPEYYFDMVRPGIILYGMPPSADVDISPLNLKHAMTIKSVVTRIHTADIGARVSYGGTFVEGEKKVLATIPVGYADGYSRLLSDRAVMSVKGKFAKVVGRICMDQCMIDVTNVNNIKVEDEVIVAGGAVDAPCSYHSLAELEGTISYELFCLTGKRVPRIYIND